MSSDGRALRGLVQEVLVDAVLETSSKGRSRRLWVGVLLSVGGIESRGGGFFFLSGWKIGIRWECVFIECAQCFLALRVTI